MPDVDGWTFYNECRWSGYDGPVIVVSGHDAARAQRELGAQGSLEKPFGIEDVVLVVHHVLGEDT
jgi:DNA-binding response OmpR family regulator